jgi:hypothetical protein
MPGWWCGLCRDGFSRIEAGDAFADKGRRVVHRANDAYTAGGACDGAAADAGHDRHVQRTADMGGTASRGVVIDPWLKGSDRHLRRPERDAGRRFNLNVERVAKPRALWGVRLDHRQALARVAASLSLGIA